MRALTQRIKNLKTWQKVALAGFLQYCTAQDAPMQALVVRLELPPGEAEESA